MLSDSRCETMHRHDLPERAARYTGMLAADAFEEIKPARMPLCRRLGRTKTNPILVAKSWLHEIDSRHSRLVQP